MTTDENTGEIISLKEAIDFTHGFQNQNPESLKSFFVGLEKLKKIFEQEKCIGMRIYKGYDASTKKTNLVLVGVDQSGKDMVDGVILERLAPCPPDCPDSSPLMNL